MNKKGFCGIGIYGSKFPNNIGTLWRTAYAFNIDFIFTVCQRYTWNKTDTVKAYRHIPLFHYQSLEDFVTHIPYNAQLICIENNSTANDIVNFVHPKSAIYLLGAEDYGIPIDFLQHKTTLQIPTQTCLNVSVAGAMVLFDRISKQRR